MDNDSIISLLKPIAAATPSKYWAIFEEFLRTYEIVLKKKGCDLSHYRSLLTTYVTTVARHLQHPFEFEPYHAALPQYQQMGLDFFAPLIDFSLSTLKGQEQIATITTLLANKENVVLFANHQTEADPYAIQLLMQPPFTMAYVAGERVVTDALAVPFSLGTNLFCVYSKKYFDVYPDRKASMMEHNKLTMLRLGEHLDQGGQCITIFPSGGRDRPNADKIIEVAKFDPQSIELLYLLGRKAKRPTHYFPMALLTHDILPPPETLQIDLGEKRPTKEAPIHIHVGQEISMDNLCDPVTLNKHQQREERAHRIWQMVYSMYHQF